MQNGEQIGNNDENQDWRGQSVFGVAGVRKMLVLDPPLLVGLAAVITSVSAFIWAVRRKP